MWLASVDALAAVQALNHNTSDDLALVSCSATLGISRAGGSSRDARREFRVRVECALRRHMRPEYAAERTLPLPSGRLDRHAKPAVLRRFDEDARHHPAIVAHR